MMGGENAGGKLGWREWNCLEEKVVFMLMSF